jgi:hypothetical protein
MPKILEERVKAIKRSSTKVNPYAIATAQLQKEGKLKKGTHKLKKKK